MSETAKFSGPPCRHAEPRNQCKWHTGSTLRQNGKRGKNLHVGLHLDSACHPAGKPLHSGRWAGGHKLTTSPLRQTGARAAAVTSWSPCSWSQRIFHLRRVLTCLFSRQSSRPNDWHGESHGLCEGGYLVNKIGYHPLLVLCLTYRHLRWLQYYLKKFDVLSKPYERSLFLTHASMLLLSSSGVIPGDSLKQFAQIMR